MANKSLFQSITSNLPRATVVNEAGGPAYKYEPKHALAQMAATGTFGNVYYANAQTQCITTNNTTYRNTPGCRFGVHGKTARSNGFESRPASFLESNAGSLTNTSPSAFSI